MTARASLVPLAALALVLAASTARADVVSVVADDITWDAADSPDLSPDMTFRLLNAVTTGDLMTGWQLRLRIISAAGATGSIHFRDAFQPGANYIFEGRTDGISGGIDPSDATMLFSFDTDNTFAGVAPDAGKTLLSVNFFADDMATGDFQVQALGNLGDTEWSDTALNDREFANVPFDDQYVTIATVHIRTVPEPSALALVGLGLPAFWLLRRRDGVDRA